MSTKKLFLTTATAAVAYLSLFAPASQAFTVVNEAENSKRGGYTVSEDSTVDPVPPAFLRGSQMRVGNDKARGLDHAADVSPALRQAVPEDTGGGGGGGGDDGGGDDGGGDDGGGGDGGGDDGGGDDGGGDDGGGGDGGGGPVIVT